MTFQLLKRWWWLAIPLGIFLSWYSGVLFERLVTERLRELGSELAGKNSTFTLDRAEPSIFAGSIIVHGITLSFDSTRVDSLKAGKVNELLHVKAEKLMIRQVSYWDLLTRKEVNVGALEIDRPYIKYLFTPSEEDTTDHVADEVVEEEKIELPSLIRLDTLLILSATGHTIDITGERPMIDVADINIKAYNGAVRAYPDGTVSYSVAGAAIEARDLKAELPPLYDARIASLKIEHPLGRAFLEKLSVTPRAGPKNYRKVIAHETDLYNIKLDSIWLKGIDVRKFIAEQVLHMRSLVMSSPVAIIHRDKSMPDGPFNYKHLPVSGLKKLGISIRIDTVEIANGKVEYHERLKQDSDFGEVVFHRINGVMTGLNNARRSPSDDKALVVKATARVYEKTTIEMHLRAPLASRNDAFTVEAEVGEIPFSALNRMTEDLLNVKATSGQIHRMRLKMSGNEDRATGDLDLEYDDLRIDLAANDGKKENGFFKNLLGNALIKKENSTDRKNYRQGRFEVERRKDRAIFNFLWQGVKIGTVDCMVPGLLRKPLKKAAQPKNT